METMQKNLGSLEPQWTNAAADANARLAASKTAAKPVYLLIADDSEEKGMAYYFFTKDPSFGTTDIFRFTGYHFTTTDTRSLSKAEASWEQIQEKAKEKEVKLKEYFIPYLKINKIEKQ